MINSMNTVVYAFILDPGHGWLQVPECDVEASGVEVSEYSPRVRGWVFLEEDCDAPAFVEACEAKGFAVRWNEVEVKDIEIHLNRVPKFNQVVFK